MYQKQNPPLERVLEASLKTFLFIFNILNLEAWFFLNVFICFLTKLSLCPFPPFQPIEN